MPKPRCISIDYNNSVTCCPAEQSVEHFLKPFRFPAHRWKKKWSESTNFIHQRQLLLDCHNHTRRNKKNSSTCNKRNPKPGASVAFWIFHCVKLCFLRWSCCGSGTSHKLLAPVSLEERSLLCIVALCSHSLDTPAVPAELVRLPLTNPTINYYFTNISVEESLLGQIIAGSSDSSFSLQSPDETQVPGSTTSGRRTISLTL